MEALMIAGAVTGAAGTVMGGINESRNQKAQAKAMEGQALQEEYNARITAQQNSAAEDLQRRQARDVMGVQAAQMAQSGFGFGGSNLLLQEQSATNAELDALNTRFEGRIKQQSQLFNAAGMRANAQMMRRNAKNTRIGSYLSAGGQLLQSAGNYSKFMGGSSTGGASPKSAWVDPDSGKPFYYY